MSAFNIPEDIANRALQHCRRQRIRLFTDHNDAAQETSSVYDKLRQAELRRNIWRFAIKRVVIRPIDLGTALWYPATYSSSLTYGLGATVAYGNDWWQSKISGNLAHTPTPGENWQHYSGQDHVEPYDYTGSTAYYSGELVIVPVAWDAVTTFVVNDIVRYSVDGLYYVSLQGANTNKAPSTQTAYWQLYAAWRDTSTHLTPPNYVGVPNIYLSLGNNNIAVAPAGSTNWLSLGGTVRNLQIVYPIGAGPAADLKTTNVYRLPRGFLRQAPTDPKANTPYAFLGVPLAPLAEDYVFEGNYFTSFSVSPILLRYVSDFVDVPDMDAMFCEGLGARIATEVAPVLVQDPMQLPIILRSTEHHYQREMHEARTVNGIETGFVEPPLDSYIACRY